MSDQDASEPFVQQLTSNQNRLYGYIFSLLGDHSRAADVLQETNLVMWRKLAEFHPEKPFLPWAFAIARFQVMAQLRDQKRDRLLLDAELAEAIGEETERQAEHIDSVRDALRQCMSKLTPGNRDLIERRYFHAHSIADTAEGLDRTVGSIKVALLRIRRQLADCVQNRLTTEGNG